MTERRTRRSGLKSEALRLLLEAVRDRSEVSSIAVIDSRGIVMSGTGTDHELAILGAIAEPIAAGSVNELCERLTEGTDVIAKAVPSQRGTVFLAALGSRIGRMREAERGIQRILAA